MVLLVACQPPDLAQPGAPIQVAADAVHRGLWQDGAVGHSVAAQRLRPDGSLQWVTPGDPLAPLGIVDGDVAQLDGVSLGAWVQNPNGSADVLYGHEGELRRLRHPYTFHGPVVSIPGATASFDGAWLGRPGDILAMFDHRLEIVGDDGGRQVVHEVDDATIARMTARSLGASMMTVVGNRPGERIMRHQVIALDGTVGSPWSDGIESLEKIVEIGPVGSDDEVRLLYQENHGGVLVTFALPNPMGGGTLEGGDIVFHDANRLDRAARNGAGLAKNAVIGDFDGDGHSDLALLNDGLPGPVDVDGDPPAGIAIYRGPLDPGTYATRDADLLFTPDAPDDHLPALGLSMAAADTNGDGLDELALGIPHANGGTGMVLVFDEPLRQWSDPR